MAAARAAGWPQVVPVDLTIVGCLRFMAAGSGTGIRVRDGGRVHFASLDATVVGCVRFMAAGSGTRVRVRDGGRVHFVSLDATVVGCVRFMAAGSGTRIRVGDRGGVRFVSSDLTVVGCVRFMAARPVTFLVLPRKVTKRRRAHEGGRCATALRCSWRAAGVANSLPAVAQTGDARRPRSPLRCSAPSRAGRARAKARARSTARARARSTATATPSPWPSPPPGAREGTAATWARRSARLASVPSPLQGERARVRGRGRPLCHRRR
jgi:hypothetical protein